MLGELCGVLRVNIGAACLHHREQHDCPEDPWQLDDLAKLKLLVLLAECFACRRIWRWAEALVGDFCEDVEDEGAEICEEGKAGSDPEDPGEVPCVLQGGDALVVRLCTQRWKKVSPLR
jgi:hypothetical protein